MYKRILVLSIILSFHLFAFLNPVDAQYERLWTSAEELMSKPMSGDGWAAVLRYAAMDTTHPDVANQDDHTNVAVLANAIAYARTGNVSYKNKVINAIEILVNRGNPGGRSLAWGRETGAYALAADLVGYRTPAFENWLRNMADTYICSQTNKTLRGMFKQRPNNWGNMAFGSLVAIYGYLGDTAKLNDVRAYWIRSLTPPKPPEASYGSLTWQVTNVEANAVWINPVGATKACPGSPGDPLYLGNGMVDIAGIIPDDMRRGGDCKANPSLTGYPWEGLQGHIMALRILDRLGIPISEEDERAIYRAGHMLQVKLGNNGWKATGDDEWMLPFFDHTYGTNWSEGYGNGIWGAGKNVGFAYVLTDNQPQCQIGLWQNQGCGLGNCAANQMYQTRTVNPPGCAIDSRCVSDPACGTLPDTEPPTVSITYPTNNQTVSGTITITANASDNVAVAGVQFKVDGNNIGSEDTQAPYEVSWDTRSVANGSHILTAVARDTSQNTATSAPITANVLNTTPSGPVNVQPTVETGPAHHSGDNADDSLIWIHPFDPSLSLVVGDDKAGGIMVWDLNGVERQYLEPTSRMNNLDIRYNFPLVGTYSNGIPHTTVALIGVNNENGNKISFFKVNPYTRLLESAGSVILSRSQPYGSCMYHSQISGKYYYFPNWTSGYVQQIELRDAGNGQVAGTRVREFDVGGQVEGCVADDILAKLYVGEEAVGVWKYGAEPGDGAVRVQVDRTGAGGHLTADVEGMSIYYTSTDVGYLIVSSQGSDIFAVYKREDNNDYLGSFKIIANGSIDAVTDSDGVDVTNLPLGTRFPLGLFIAHDHSNAGAIDSNHKYVPWERIANALNLAIDTTWDPRLVGTEPENPTMPPTVPVGLYADATSRVNLTWETNPAEQQVTQYHIHKDTALNGSFPLLDEVPGNLHIYIDSDIILGQHYYYKIKAINAAGESQLSEAVLIDPRADFDNDGLIALLDLVLLQQAIYQSLDLRFDLNEDGYVNLDDVSVFSQWFQNWR